MNSIPLTLTVVAGFLLVTVLISLAALLAASHRVSRYEHMNSTQLTLTVVVGLLIVLLVLSLAFWLLS
jgi:uncharacterized membrane protein YjgN (DUF898 family)